RPRRARITRTETPNGAIPSPIPSTGSSRTTSIRARWCSPPPIPPPPSPSEWSTPPPRRPSIRSPPTRSPGSATGSRTSSCCRRTCWWSRGTRPVACSTSGSMRAFRSSGSRHCSWPMGEPTSSRSPPRPTGSRDGIHSPSGCWNRFGSKSPELRRAGSGFGKEQRKLALGRGRRIAPVDQVLGDGQPEVATDGPRRGGRGIGESHHRSKHTDGIAAGQLEHNHVARRDEVDQLGEERLVLVFRVVMLGQVDPDPHHPEVVDAKTLPFDA